MSEINNGGPAFPEHQPIPDFCGGVSWRTVTPGLSMRDYFAAKAMSAALHIVGGSGCGVDSQGFVNDEDAATMAANCYSLADAMLKARENGQQL